MSFFKKLASALVETGEVSDAPGTPTSAADIEKELAAIRKVAPAPATPAASAPTPPTPPPTPTAPTVTAIVEGVPFQTMYTEAGVPQVPYTADMLLQVVDKLATMPKTQLMAMVTAMDEADDRWTLADVIGDANNKRQALQGRLIGLGTALKTVEDTTSATILSLDAQYQEMAKEIQDQIAALQQTLVEAKTETDAQKVQASEQLAATRAAHSKESARISAEFDRLGRLQNLLQ